MGIREWNNGEIFEHYRSVPISDATKTRLYPIYREGVVTPD